MKQKNGWIWWVIFGANAGIVLGDSWLFKSRAEAEAALGGKMGRGAAGKTPVFGLLKRNGKVFVTIVPNCSKEELMPITQGKILMTVYER